MQSTLSKNLPVEQWGLVPYQQAFERQRRYVDEIIAGTRNSTLVFCQHPPVVTLGRATQDSDLFGWRGETIEVNRGGRATYHGPNQLVIYPILDLSDAGSLKITAKDLHGYMRTLEDTLVELLSLYGVEAAGHTQQRGLDGSLADATGVWVGSRKIASIGIAVKRWITSHGMAFNLYHDELAFSGINPCGFSTQTMVSLEEITGERVRIEQISSQFSTLLGRRLLGF